MEQPARGVFVVSFFSVAYNQKSSSIEINHLDLDSGCPGPNPVLSLARCDFGQVVTSFCTSIFSLVK